MKSIILDASGAPFNFPTGGKVQQRGETKTSATYVRALRRLNAEPIERAAEPFASHAWVYAAATALAINAAQAPLRIFRETDTSKRARVKHAEKHGYPVGPFIDKRRKAIGRFCQQPGRRRTGIMRGVEVDPEHPLNDLLLRPNPRMTMRDLVIQTIVNLSTDGEGFWCRLNKDMVPALGAEPVAAIEPITPKYVTDYVARNTLTAWQIIVERGSVIDRPAGTRLTVDPQSMLHFKYFNPADKIRGLSPLSAASMSVVLDLAALRHNKGVMENGADPGGILVDRSPNGMGQEALSDYHKLFNERYGGVGLRGETAMLPANIDYLPIGLKPKDMDWEVLRRMTREDVLAVLGVPKSIVSVTDDLNYSIQISQDANFWDKRLLPILLLLEAVFDTGLMWLEPDDVVMAFDLSGIQALRNGLKEAIENAKSLASETLHVPPRQAFAIAGVEVEEDYPGIDDAFGSPLTATPIRILIEQAEQDFLDPPEPPPVAPPQEAPPEDDQNAPPMDPDAPPEETTARAAAVRRCVRAAEARRELKASQWATYVRRVAIPTERKVIRKYRGWVRRERDIVLERLDAQTRMMRSWERPRGKIFSIDAILSSVPDVQARLRESMRSAILAGANLAYEYTTHVDLAGITVFEATDPRLARVILNREQLLVGTTPQTIQRNLRRSMSEAIANGETLGEIRDRVRTVYGTAGSPSKTATVARTEASGIANAIRDEMFTGAGVENAEWETAGDEVVRDHHKVFGAAGKQPRGFNYLSLVSDGGVGRLRYPHDPEGPAEEVINCRCVLLAIVE